MRTDLTVDVRVLRNQQNNSTLKTIQLKTCHTRTTALHLDLSCVHFIFAHFSTPQHSAKYTVTRFLNTNIIFASISINTLHKVATIFFMVWGNQQKHEKALSLLN